MSRALWVVLLLLLAACRGTPPSTKSGNFYERYQAVRELRQRRDAEAIGEIVRLLDDDHPLVVTGALQSLALIGDPGFLQHIVPLFTHESPMVRAQACVAVGDLENPGATSLLLKAIKDDAVPVRREAVKAVEVFGDQARVLAALAEAVGDEDPGVALLAHEQLQALTGLDDVPRTRKAWENALP